MDELDSLNKTELIELIRVQTNRRVARDLSEEELKRLVEIGKIDKPSSTEKTRRRLQVFLEKDKELYAANLPCMGQVNEAKCSIFPCTEIQHVECWNNLSGKING